MSKSLMQEKGFSFAVRVVLYCRTHLSGKEDEVLSRQLLRSGTSIGANVEVALGGQSRKEFTAKLGIAAREARETRYWLRLVQEGDTERESEAISLENEYEEVLKLRNSIILTARRKAIPLAPNSRLRTAESSLVQERKTQDSQLRTSPSESVNELRSQNSKLRTPG
jgi:four helix bundle protein